MSSHRRLTAIGPVNFTRRRLVAIDTVYFTQQVAAMASAGVYPPIPDDVVAQPKYAVIGGSGVTVAGEERFCFQTPLGLLVNISFLDEAKRVVHHGEHGPLLPLPLPCSSNAWASLTARSAHLSRFS